MLFTFRDVDFSSFIESWLNLSSSYQAAFNIFFGIQYGPPAYIDMKYALIAQSLMLYYTRTAEGRSLLAKEEQTLKELLRIVPAHAGWLFEHLNASPYPPFHVVLKRLVDLHGETLDPLLSGRREAFVNQAANTLRYIEQRRDVEHLAASHGSDLYWMMEKLRFLIKACLLSELDFPPDVVRKLLQTNDYYQHILRLEASREAKRSTVQ
jgi:hypothetical protein